MKSEEKKLIEQKALEFSHAYNYEITKEEFLALILKCIECKSVESSMEESIDLWFRNRFEPNVFKISEEIYLKAMIEALKIQFLIAGTDFGSSRQRDFGQKWSDTIRGYLGEFGVQLWLKDRWGIDVKLDHEKGDLGDFLPLDIHEIRLPTENNYRKPNLRISIKSTKSNGIWLDIPGDQFHHSDIFILTKLIITTDHLFSFFKSISVFQDKILKLGLDKGFLTKEASRQIYDNTPSFKPVYGYVAGFIENNKKYESHSYEYLMGRVNAKIYSYSGTYEGDKTLAEIKSEIGAKEKHKEVKKCEFLGIGKFNNSKRYVFGMKNLRYKPSDWKSFVIDKI